MHHPSFADRTTTTVGYHETDHEIADRREVLMTAGSSQPRPSPQVPATPSTPGPVSAGLLERESALNLLAAEADRAMSGSGRLVLFRAPTGTGRSALLEAAAEQGARLGMRVLRAHASAHCGAPLALVRLLLNAPSDLDGLDNNPETPHHSTSSSRLWRLLCEHAAESPLLVAVDDAHLADQPSRRWLTEAARRLTGMPVLMVVTERGQYDIAPPAPGIAYSLPPGVVRMHAVAPLSRPAAEELVRGVLGADTSDTWVDGCVRAGAGNPLLLRSLLDDLRVVFPHVGSDNGGPEPRLPQSCAELYPGAFVAAVSWWLKSAGPGSTTVARALAELEDSAPERNDDGREGGYGFSGGPGTPGVHLGPDAHNEPAPGHDFGDFLSELTGADPDRVGEWVTAMIRLGLLRRSPGTGVPGFAHPLLRGAVLDGWPRSQRQALHHRAAGLRQRRGDGAEAVAGHLLRTTPAGAGGGTASIDKALLDAAADASRAGRTGAAALYLRRALDEPLPRERRAAVLTELGELEFATLRTGGIPRLAEALRLQEQPRKRVLAAVNLGNALANRGRPHAALDVMRDLGPLDAEPVLARTVETASAFFSDHDQEIRRAVYTRLSERAEHSPDGLNPALRALLIRYRAAAGLLSAESAVRQIRRLLTTPEDPLLMPYLLATAATVTQWADAPDDAERLIRTALTEHWLTPLHPVHQSLLNTRVDTAAARGHYQWVLEETAGSLRTPDDAARTGVSNFLAHRVIALVERGRSAEAERLIAGIRVEETQEGWEPSRFLYARGVLRASVGDPAGALADFRECGRRQLGRDVESPLVTPWRSAAAECHLLLGDAPQALALAEEERRYAAVWGTPRVQGRALRVLGAATGGRRGLELTAAAVAILRGTSLDVELVPALITHGLQLTAAGQPRRARTLLREAATTAERLGAVRLSGNAELALRASGTRRRNTSLTGPDSLTAGERRIAALAADGRTNAEISGLLHLALRTVETHLTSTYRKLGIRRRVDLPAVLNSGTEEPT
ncbi:LuxR C-terminal-related transcriptional regulator [Streptomyces sp. SPB162]|uniref:helix-turn-helix transcriptional regulator n=1 Tax=Streptomyces sp. SPB162 TaxID=2940560 RepID=UPI0024054C2A|nr:LuxR C-terminal-related transcriptional regulator [Streptomyces sp. SPB162]MDF9817094.1 DNA-binding CsgD family transcriptional regulator [Streptomyces sp. SPB162]